MRTVAPIAVLVLLVAGCAHHAPAGLSASAPRLARAHAVGAWTGEVRIAIGSGVSELDGQGATTTMVEGTVRALIEQLGIPAKVECLTQDGDLAVFGAVHARVRVAFPGRVSLEQKYEALGVLEGLRPNAGAFADRTSPRAAGGAGGISASVTP